MSRQLPTWSVKDNLDLQPNYKFHLSTDGNVGDNPLTPPPPPLPPVPKCIHSGGSFINRVYPVNLSPINCFFRHTSAAVPSACLTKRYFLSPVVKVTRERERRRRNNASHSVLTGMYLIVHSAVLKVNGFKVRLNSAEE